ncbi:MAG: response regulator [Blautia sp.]|nr:response regulator [Blautia sp.]
MKTVLIVEDEKFIRQGIRTMIQRSGVPVEVLMECSNGEAALEVLKNHPVDVMFTDIRMPKMDGIELVREIQKLEEKPLIVAVSGYDDFSYAVEMMRNGVREYILKPVERQRIVEVMQKLEAEVSERNQRNRTDIRIGENQIKLLLASDASVEKEFVLLGQKYEGVFFPEGYRVCVAGKGFRMEERENTFFMDEMPECNLCIFAPELLPVMLKNELWSEYVGVSLPHQGLKELKSAYEEAFDARRRAFYRRENVILGGEEETKGRGGCFPCAGRA